MTPPFLIITRLFMINKIFSSPTLDEAWIKDKWETYLKYCLPSLRNQTDKNFEHIILINEDFPHYNSIRESVEKKAAKGYFTLRYVTFPWGDGAPVVSPFCKNISNFTKDHILKQYHDAEWLITARLDGDDMIAKDYVEKVRSRFKEEEFWVSFEEGYYWNVAENVFRFKKEYLNANLVFIEPVGENLKTVYYRIHNKITVKPGDEKLDLVTGTGRGWWISRVASEANLKKSKKYIDSQRWFGKTPVVSKEEIEKHFA